MKKLEQSKRFFEESRRYLAGGVGSHARRTPELGTIFFKKGKGYWEHNDTIELPAGLEFENYASLAFHGNRMAVVSSDASAIWLGELEPDAWAVAGDGAVYRFPLSKKGNVAYCAVDGISWLDDSTFVAVSDHCRSTFGFQKRCRKKDQSIHIFSIPAA